MKSHPKLRNVSVEWDGDVRHGSDLQHRLAVLIETTFDWVTSFEDRQQSVNGLAAIDHEFLDVIVDLRPLMPAGLQRMLT